MIHLDNLAHLAAFAAVARHNSFRKAAQELGLSASAISYAVRTLETRLGVTLFNRTTRSVALSAAGQSLLARLQPALNDVGDALEEMNHFRETPSGILRVNSSRHAAMKMIAPIIRQYLDTYPDIQMEIASDDSMVDIVASGFDVGVRYEESVPVDMIAVSLGMLHRYVVVGSPAYFKDHSIPYHPDDLATQSCIRYRFPSGSFYKWELAKDGVALEIDVKGRLTASDQALAISAAMDGVGLTYAPEEDVAGQLAQGTLVCVLEDWCPVTPGLVLYYPRQRQMSSALRAFIDMARTYHAVKRP